MAECKRKLKPNPEMEQQIGRATGTETAQNSVDAASLQKKTIPMK